MLDDDDDGQPLDVRFLPEPLVGGSQGAFEGIVAGCLLAITIAVLSTRPQEELRGALIGLVLAACVLSLSAAAWRTVSTAMRSRALLFGSGVAAGLVTVAPLAMSEAAKDGHHSEQRATTLLVAGLVAGAVAGIVQVATGSPLERLPRHHPLARILLLLAYLGAPGGIALVAAESTAAGTQSAGIAVLSISVLPFVAFAAGFARRVVGNWRQQGRTKSRFAGRDLRLLDSSDAASAEVELAALATDAASRRSHLGSALEHARAAHSNVASQPTYEPSLSSERRRHLELAFLLGHMGEIDALTQECPLEPYLAAERARLEGDPGRAVELARAAVSSSESTAADRAHALCVQALAETDLGRYADAWSRLAAIRRAQVLHAPLLGRFRVERIAERIDERETAQARKAGAALEARREVMALRKQPAKA